MRLGLTWPGEVNGAHQHDQDGADNGHGHVCPPGVDLCGLQVCPALDKALAVLAGLQPASHAHPPKRSDQPPQHKQPPHGVHRLAWGTAV